jgi:hypothetical protein
VFQVEVEIFTTPFGQQVFPVAASLRDRQVSLVATPES